MSCKNQIERPQVGSVSIKDRFWTPYTAKIHHLMLPYVLRKFEESGYMENFKYVAQGKTGEHNGPPFSDGLFYETLRGASDFLASEYDPELDRKLDEYIKLIEDASSADPDGFICTNTTLMYPDKRFGENGGDIIIQHDLYDQGALVEAAVSHYLATGKTTLLKCAVRAANYICSYIGEPPKKPIIPGHSLPEEAFIKLYRLFRDHRELSGFAGDNNVDFGEYLRVALYWLDSRGDHSTRPASGHFAPEYNQDNAPFGAQREAVGHAVRATLFYTGAAAAEYETRKPEYKRALDLIWDDTVNRKLHISGGIGTRHDIEGFDADYNLPNDAYLETCAAIGLAFWSGEMNLLEPRAEYFDCFERSLYNNILASVSEDGEHYFYQNPLISEGGVKRWEWHGCPCCPPMLLKLFSSLSSYIYYYSDDSVYANMFIGSEYKNESFSISQNGGRFTLDSKGRALTLKIRIPDYAENFSLKLNGAVISYETVDGYACVSRIWKAEDELKAEYSAPPRRFCANPSVEADRGLTAVMRGPYLLCVEGIDNNGKTDLELADDPRLEPEADGAAGYASDGTRIRMIPYYRWCSRGDSPMRVWLRQENMKPEDKINAIMKGRLYYDYDKI